MKRTLAACLSVAATALIALVVVAPSAASAAEIDFACKAPGVDECYFHAVQTGTHTFTINGAPITCTGVTLLGSSNAATGGTTVKTVGSGELDWATHTVKMRPTYSGCKVAGQIVTITTTGCDYTFTATSRTVGNTTIDCEVGKEIIFAINTASCKISVGAQTPGVPTVELKKESTGATADILLTSKVAGIKYTGSGGICGGSASTGTYTGSVTTKCFKNSLLSVQVGCTPVETVETEIKE